MREPLVTADATLGEAQGQFAGPVDLGHMPPYVQVFLARLRLLIGVPFAYLIPDARLLPDESIRFFYIDRSWTDRLIDGAMAVGSLGTRERAHYAALAETVYSTTDANEQSVRASQGGAPFTEGETPSTSVVTGFLLRSALVSGWPHMSVTAYSGPEATNEAQLELLRLEQLSPAVMVALFLGVPQLVLLEEPHHSIQFGNFDSPPTVFTPRDWDNPAALTTDIPLSFRGDRARQVLDVTALQTAIGASAGAPNPTTASGFAYQLLELSKVQPFEGPDSLAQCAGTTKAVTTMAPWEGGLKLAEGVQHLSVQTAVATIRDASSDPASAEISHPAGG